MSSLTAGDNHLKQIKAVLRSTLKPTPGDTRMTNDTHVHEVAILAAQTAQTLSCTVWHGSDAALPTPAQGAANVTAAYLAAVKELTASSGTASPESAA